MTKEGQEAEVCKSLRPSRVGSCSMAVQSPVHVWTASHVRTSQQVIQRRVRVARGRTRWTRGRRGSRCPPTTAHPLCCARVTSSWSHYTHRTCFYRRQPPTSDGRAVTSSPPSSSAEGASVAATRLAAGKGCAIRSEA